MNDRRDRNEWQRDNRDSDDRSSWRRDDESSWRGQNNDRSGRDFQSTGRFEDRNYDRNYGQQNRDWNQNRDYGQQSSGQQSYGQNRDWNQNRDYGQQSYGQNRDYNQNRDYGQQSFSGSGDWSQNREQQNRDWSQSRESSQNRNYGYGFGQQNRDYGYPRDVSDDYSRRGEGSSFGRGQSGGYRSDSDRWDSSLGNSSSRSGRSGYELGSSYGGGGSSDAGARYGASTSSASWGNTALGSSYAGPGQQGNRSRDYGVGEQSRSFSGRGPKGYTRSDDRIREDVCERLSLNDDVDASDISVTVKGGEVTLEGTVETRRMKHIAEDIAESVSGVKDVTNNIRVRKGFFNEIADKLSGNESEQHHANSGTKNTPATGASTSSSSTSSTSTSGQSSLANGRTS